LLQKRDARVPDQNIQNQFWFELFDLLYHRRILKVTHNGKVRRDQIPVLLLSQLRFDQRFDRTRTEPIGPDKNNPLFSTLLFKPLQRRKHKLVGSCTGIDDIGRLFESLIGSGIEQQTAQLLKERLDGLTATGSKTAKHHGDFVFSQHAICCT